MCSNELIKWSAKKKMLSDKEINEKMLRLNFLQAKSVLDIVAVRRLGEDIGLWSDQDNLKWKQRPKKDWYKLDDQNTKFFMIVHPKEEELTEYNLFEMLKTLLSPPRMRQMNFFETIFSKCFKPLTPQ